MLPSRTKLPSQLTDQSKCRISRHNKYYMQQKQSKCQISRHYRNNMAKKLLNQQDGTRQWYRFSLHLWFPHVCTNSNPTFANLPKSAKFSFPGGGGGILGLFSFEVSIQFWNFFIFLGGGGTTKTTCN